MVYRFSPFIATPLSSRAACCAGPCVPPWRTCPRAHPASAGVVACCGGHRVRRWGGVLGVIVTLDCLSDLLAQKLRVGGWDSFVALAPRHPGRLHGGALIRHLAVAAAR